MASTSDLVATSDMQSAKAAKKRKLMLTFIALLFVGLCNKVCSPPGQRRQQS